MGTQNPKFTVILLAGLFAGGALALGYACGGDDTTGPATTGGGGIPTPDSGPTGTGGAAGAGTGGSAGAGTGGTAGAGTGGTAGGGTGGAAGMNCQVSGSFDNVKAKTLFPADGGVPAL
jgi:hypothetical protein